MVHGELTSAKRHWVLAFKKHSNEAREKVRGSWVHVAACENLGWLSEQAWALCDIVGEDSLFTSHCLGALLTPAGGVPESSCRLKDRQPAG